MTARHRRDARLGYRNGRFGIMTARALLLGAVPHPNMPGAHPQHPRERRSRIGPMSHEGLDQRLAGRAVTKEPLNSNYISIWLWGVFPAQCSVASALW